MVVPKKLDSISECGDQTPVNGSLGGYSTYTGYTAYTRSPSGNSLNTISIASRNYKNTLLDRTSNVESALAQRLSSKTSITHKHNDEVCKKVRVSMALFGILLLVAAIFMLSFYLPKQYEDVIEIKEPLKEKRFIWDDNIEMDDLYVTFSTNFSSEVLESEIGPRISLKAYFGELLTKAAHKNFTKVVTDDNITITFRELDQSLVTLKIQKQKFSNHCYEISWVSTYYRKLQDCFDTKSAHWFGLGECFVQKWPINKGSFPITPFLTSDYIDDFQPNVFGGVLEPFIINHKGAGIYVDDNVPLHVSMNDKKNGKFCIRADRNKYNVPYVDENSTNILKYTICIADNIKKVHKVMFDQYIKKPIGVPDKRTFLEPIWSTWVKFKKNINQTLLIKYVDEINKHGFPGSHIQIDDQYSSNYGDFDFDINKFPDIVGTINIIRSSGFRISIWISPFANLQSKAFLQSLKDWVKVGIKDVPGITLWWNGVGGILDTTNEAARQHFVQKLAYFKKLRIDGFKFDAGEVNYLPLMFRFKNEQVNPNYYSYYYVKLATEVGSEITEVRVGYKSQEFPVFVRLLDRSSYWNTENGLQSVLTATLTFSILGYPFVLPDMVGGNAYIRKPNRELYVRWAQLSAFLPAIQFSLTPWEFDDEVVTIVKQALEIRKNLSEILYQTASDVQITGEPIIRPLWWYWPDDHETSVVHTEFMFGDMYLIAPVLHLNIVSHAIYLPVGIWEEQWGKRRILNMTKGTFNHYNVTLADICYFKRIVVENDAKVNTTEEMRSDVLQ